MKGFSRGLIGLISFALCVPPAFCTENGWSLVQSARGLAALSGSMTLYITPAGMRSSDAKTGVNLMTHGPDWTIYIFNEKTKKVYSSPLKPWLASFKQRNMVGRFEGATWKRGTDNFAIAGVRAYQFMMDKPPVTKTSSKALNGRVKNFKSLQGASLWVASDIQTPPEVSNLLSQIYGVPDCQRIPLRVVVNEVGVGKSTAVDTLKISHLSVPDSAFAVPNGYQIAKTDTEVFIDKESADTIDEMLQDLDKPSTPRGHATQSYQRPGQATQRRY